MGMDFGAYPQSLRYMEAAVSGFLRPDLLQNGSIL